MLHVNKCTSMKMSGDMFEGKDYPTEWALTPSSYQNMNNDQVDWAALAQQWIKMKETSIPPAPPPPSIADHVQGTSSSDGGGEAPMDVDTKDDDIPPAPPAPNISGTDSWNQWNQWDSHWNSSAAASSGPENWEWNLPGVADSKSIAMPNISDNVLVPPPAPIISSTGSSFNSHCNRTIPVPTVPPPIPPTYGYNTMPHVNSQFNNQGPPGNFWNNEHPAVPGANIPVQPPFIKNVRHNSHRAPILPTPPNVIPCTDIPTSRNRDFRERTPEEDISITLDTVKRRQLPAWIREGLEKMEREKQKAVERERQEILRKQELEARKMIEDQARAVLNPSKSKFDSDSEKETTDQDVDDDKKENNSAEIKSQKESAEVGSPDLIKPRKSRFHDASSSVTTHPRAPLTKEKITEESVPSTTPTVKQSKEEILQNLMLKVRRSLTEILLEVTNDEISSVCKEVWKRTNSKGKSLIHAPQNAAPVAQITRKLGLGIYGDSNSESEEEQSPPNEHSQQSPGENDSDEELKETLRRRQQAFRRTEAEIEARIAQEEEEEQERDDDDEESEGSKKDGDVSSRERKRSRVEGSDRKETFVGNTSSFRTVDNEKDTVYGSERRAPSRTAAASKPNAGAGSHGHKEDQQDNSSGAEDAARSKQKKSGDKGSRPHAKGSSSRSRSRSRHRSSRSQSRESSRSVAQSVAKLDAAAPAAAATATATATAAQQQVTGKSAPPAARDKGRARKGSEKREARSKSRSSSRSPARYRSRSSSRSRSRSRYKRRHSRGTRSPSSSRRRRRRSRSRSKRSRSRNSRSRNSRSKSRSRSRKRSRSSYSQKSGGPRRRGTRSPSAERSRRSRSSTRSSRNYHSRHRPYRRDRDGSYTDCYGNFTSSRRAEPII